ncbi:MAG: Ig-like domain-containing protein [Gemmatimonadales bacterium]
MSRGPSALLLLCSSALLSCANVQPPPGGPPDAVAPELLAAVPDSLAILPGYDDDVEFRFSEVIAEGSQPSQGLGTSDLERLVILSPTDRVPEVRWRRRRITVRPAEGWQPDRVYRVELLPGVTDVRRNRADVHRVVTFTTGAALPEDSLGGTVIDWKVGRPAAGALVEAVMLPDSLVYRAVADSSGNFRLRPLPRGEYLVYGVIDGNKNLRRDPREAFDSTRVPADSARAGDLYAFVHDTLPPRIQTIAPADSVTATVTFALPLDPAQRLDSSAVTLRQLPDSAPVAVRGLRLPPTDGRAVRQAGRDARETGDSVGKREDSLPARPPARQPADSARRPALNDRLVLEAAEPWRPGDRFLVEIRGVRTVSGIGGDVRAPLVIPEAGKRPAGRADSAKGEADGRRRKQAGEGSAAPDSSPPLPPTPDRSRP